MASAAGNEAATDGVQTGGNRPGFLGALDSDGHLAIELAIGQSVSESENHLIYLYIYQLYHAANGRHSAIGP